MVDQSRALPGVRSKSVRRCRLPVTPGPPIYPNTTANPGRSGNIAGSRKTMGDLPHYFDIILFAMVAAFLVLRLRSVLGRRTGQERRPDPVLRRAEAPPGEKLADKVVALGTRNPAVPPPVVTATPPDAVAAGLERIHTADPGFEPAQFLEGARFAFEMIVGAFAAGDKARLRPLLSDDVYQPFA